MSPASQGALEVERYIGSCLISSTVRPSMHKEFVCKKASYPNKNYALNGGGEQCQGQYGSGTWAGTPLISMTSTPRRSNQQRSSPSLAQQQQPQQQSQQKQQCSNEQQLPGHLHNKSPLVRLAIHTQGVPLILTGRFHNRGKTHNTGVNSNVTGSCTNNNSNGASSTMATGASRCPGARVPMTVEQSMRKLQNQQSAPNCAKDAAPNNIKNIDSLSIASDESSENNSENSLPRIIKPRKRRKKDRKPPNATVLATEMTKQQDEQPLVNPGCPGSNALEQTSAMTTSAIAKPPQSCYESATPHFRGQRRPQTMGRESAYGRLHSGSSSSSSLQEVVDTTRHRYAYRHVQVKVLDDNRNVIVPMPVRQVKGYRTNVNNNNNITNNNIAARYAHDMNDRPEASCQGRLEDCYGACQCRYCDPSGLIWDSVDRNGYPPFLPGVPYPQQVPVFLSPYTCHEQFFDVESPSGVCLHRDRDVGVAVLRRSWSDPVSYFSDEIVPNRDVGVIGDRGQSELKGRATTGSWRGDTLSPSSDANSSSSLVSGNTSGAISQGLEVSTEIVTSPNGHRDLEIKFYSSSPSSVAQEEDKATFAFPGEDDDDFSDIWSYHESKLQQDFRTLLQAEE